MFLKFLFSVTPT
ncbi:MAG TPA: hypothetical protein DER08_06290 [Flavobacterium sp.]|nr:hypothetical protein [Flavobacterium sp.]